jgi:hypothetical protein
MPTIDSIQEALPCCPGLFSNLSHDRTQRELCGRAMRWDDDAAQWRCDDHGPRLSGAEAAALLSEPGSADDLA